MHIASNSSQIVTYIWENDFVAYGDINTKFYILVPFPWTVNQVFGYVTCICGI